MTDPIIPFEIHPSSGVPIYRQFIDQVYALIAGGKISQGELLPSVRRVAAAASVNPMTVSKAYSRLEAEGVVERVRGQGMRVCQSVATGTLAQRRQQFRRLAEPVVYRSRQLGLSEQEVRNILDELIHKLDQEKT